jgi:3-deoxy-D-manno-octulosonate 8-phosphate phosphatase (KDO 8-P phosphatase)
MDAMTAAERAARVRLLILDVDGVLTDGRLYFGPQGEAIKVFDVRDGHGIKLLHEAGVRTAILSSRKSGIVALRARELGIAFVLQGEADKARGLAKLIAETGIAVEHCGYVGDDWPDLPVLQQVGFAAAVADARPEVKAVAHWTANSNGGYAAVREVAEFILGAQGRLQALLDRHSTHTHHA